MLDDDDDRTAFEQNPLGNRQRLVPRASFLKRHCTGPTPKVEVVDEATAAVRGSMILDVLTHDEALESGEYTHDEALVNGEHTIGNLALPSNSAVMLPALAIATPVPSLVESLPQAAALMLLPKEIDYRGMHYPAVATPYYPPTESHHALPVASRRFRYLAVPAIAVLALIVLGGAAIPVDLEAHAPAAHTSRSEESVGAPRSSSVTQETEAPPEPAIEEAPKRIVFASRARTAKIAPKPLAKRLGKQRKVVVNTSSALGNLRPKKAW